MTEVNYNIINLSESESSLREAVESRRTFAIISHPDAGKTTLTEKLLLYSGMVRTAGMVRGRKGSKHASSDWMAMEQERGISVSASAMQFVYKGATVNVLDTPGHQDFSEDTYRTLTAADSAIMVLDAAKGVEEQTRKLFTVCRMQRIPILTFINKMDQPPRDLLELLQEIENVLGIQSSPINWPIGSGKRLVGVYDRTRNVIQKFRRSESGGSKRADIIELSLAEARDGEHWLEPDLLDELQEYLELLEGAGTQFSRDAFLKGQITPVFFGSALTNFGVEPFFDAFVNLAPAPRAYPAVINSKDGNAAREIVVDPIKVPFSAYVFKIQANMNPRHRDSMAFLRVCSGEFTREMVVYHHRLGREVRLSRSYAMVARDRDTVESAYPGDIVGVINPGVFAIGDTISVGQSFNYLPMPQFPPEVVAELRPKEVLRRKSFEKGLAQLATEGAIQLLRRYSDPSGSPLVAAVGKLQFEVLQYRLDDEYKVETELTLLPYKHGVYIETIGSEDSKSGKLFTNQVSSTAGLILSQGSIIALDSRDRLILLYTSEWEQRFIAERNPNVRFLNILGSNEISR
jgi:peptide chain release factor 3